MCWCLGDTSFEGVSLGRGRLFATVSHKVLRERVAEDVS